MAFLSFSLNTGLRFGNDAVKLGIRLYAQCEIHAYVEGPNREWLAQIIDQGRASNLFRSDMGWEGVAALLRKSTQTTVVTSFSGSDDFPDEDMVIKNEVWTPPIGDKPNELGETAWDRLGKLEQWCLSMEALRKYNRGGRLELKPDNWNDFHFGPNFSAFDL